MSPDIKETFSSASGFSSFTATLIPSNRTRSDHCWGESEQKKRRKRCEAAAAIELESTEVTGESGVLRLTWHGRAGWTDSQKRPEFCVSAMSHVRWQALEQRLGSKWQFCLRCNSQSQKPVKSDISIQQAFFHFAKCIHKSSGWVNFNWQLPSFITFDIQILFFCSWNWFVSKSEITYWTQVGGIKLMAGCDSEPADGLVAPRRCPNMEPIQCKQKKQRNSTQKHLLFKLSISPSLLVLWVSLMSTLRDKICARDWEAIRL